MAKESTSKRSSGDGDDQSGLDNICEHLEEVNLDGNRKRKLRDGVEKIIEKVNPFKKRRTDQ